MCIFRNPLFYTEFVAYLDKKKSKLNFNAVLTHTKNTENREFRKQKVYKLILLDFPGFYVMLKIKQIFQHSFQGGSYFAKGFETSSWSSFLLQRLSVISANCLLMGRLFFSSSLKVAVNSFKSICVVMWCLCARASPHFRSQASPESRPRRRVSGLPNPSEMSLSLLP